jgi:hypothetical protein
MRVEKFSFGSIRIDGTTYEHDVVIDRGEGSETRSQVPQNQTIDPADKGGDR